MRPDARALARLRRLERTRTVERAEAARNAAEAQATADRLATLSARSAKLAEDYRSTHTAADGDALQRQASFCSELISLSCRTADDSAAAVLNAARRRIALARSTRRRDLAAQHVRRKERELARAAEHER